MFSLCLRRLRWRWRSLWRLVVWVIKWLSREIWRWVSRVFFFRLIILRLLRVLCYVIVLCLCMSRGLSFWIGVGSICLWLLSFMRLLFLRCWVERLIRWRVSFGYIGIGRLSSFFFSFILRWRSFWFYLVFLLVFLGWSGFYFCWWMVCFFGYCCLSFCYCFC